MKKPRKHPGEKASRAASGNVAYSRQGALRSCTVGALPILNDLLKRMRLEEFLQAYLPPKDHRSKLAPAKALLVLLRNLLLSREPIYGMGEWAARHAPDLLGLSPQELSLLNDDREGRAMDCLFQADVPSLVLAVATHTVREFQVGLDELHNDSTSITVHGAYATAAEEHRYQGRPTLAITFGHNKDHRPDLKQLLYILTVTNDGGVPIHFRAESGNTTDDQTHCDSWELLCQLTGRRDFLYVADCKLASRENMTYLDRRGGRFVTVLPRTRSEDAAFRKRLLESPIAWHPLWEKTDDEGNVIDSFSVLDEPTVTDEGFRLLWYHSTRKAELDAATRTHHVEQALLQLGQLRRKLAGPRTRYHQADQVQQAVDGILEACDAVDFAHVRILPREQERFRQETRGRPGPTTRYVKNVSTRFDLDYEIDVERLYRQRQGDGVFPLVSNDRRLSELELLHAYKRQPTIEKRFSQLKTDFTVAPVYLKRVHRIQALLCLYFFALLIEALLERELRRAMKREGIEDLPMYPEGRACRWPTARRLIDLFEPIQRHTLECGNGKVEVIGTELTKLQRKILKLLKITSRDYGG